MSGYYTSFRIKNTTDVPIILSVTDSDGNLLRVGRLKPGKESIQVAPINASWSIERSDAEPLKAPGLPAPDQQTSISASWSIERSNLDPAENVDSPAHDREKVVPLDPPKIEAMDETTPQLLDSANSEPIPYESFLKIETGSHTARINQLLVTPDGKSLITSGEDKTIRIWDVEDKKQTGILLGQIGDGEEGKIRAIAMSRDGRYIVALAWMYPDGTHDPHERETDIRVYELATGNLQACYHYPGTLTDLDFSPGDKYLVMVGNPKGPARWGYVQVYDASALLEGFGAAPAPLASDALYEYHALIPAYVRFVPDHSEEPAVYRIVVTTWYQYQGPAEYTGGLLWYSFSSDSGLEKILSRDTEDHIPPESLAVSSKFVIVTAHWGLQKFYCYDHTGKLIATVLSDSIPAAPAFSQDESQLIVGQRGDSALVQVKVYDTALGQFQLKSTYYGHDSEVVAAALLQDGTAVSAGGDQNAIHFWGPVHLEGEQTAVIRGSGRVVHAVGMNQNDQIGIGNHDDLRVNGDIVLQRVFDLRAMTLKPLSIKDSAAFQRAKTHLGELSMEWRVYENAANLWLLSSPSQDRPWPYEQALTGTPDPKNDRSFLWYNVTTFGFTENLAIITGDREGKVRVAPRRADETYAMLPWRILVGHEARVLDHAASGKWLVTSGADQVIRLWYLEDVEQQNAMADLEPALNLFIGADDEWVIWSKSGYYMASQNGDRYLGYHVNRGPYKEALFFSSDRFHSVFLRPDIIKAILMYGSEERVREKETESKISIRSIQVEEILPPIIELDKDGMKKIENKKEGFVTFTLTVQSHGKPIKRLCVLRNGRFAHMETSVPLSGKMTISKLPLLPGKNHFKIFAENQDAQLHTIKSNPIEQTIEGPAKYEDQAVLEKGMLYILAIGVSRAINLKKRMRVDEQGDFELRFAHKDADAIYQAFANDNKAFEGVEQQLLVNEQATLAGINMALDDICQKINKKVEDRITNREEAKRDVLLVYLSGHGIFRTVDQQLYFWNYDYDPEKPGETGLAFTDLGEKITALPAEVILMTDACKSGMAGSDVVKSFDPDQDGVDPNELAKRIYGLNESDIYIFNAARRSESAVEDTSIQHGYFTRSILDALDDIKNPELTMLGLIDQVQWRVQGYMKQRKEQDPQKVVHNPVCRMYGDLLPLVIYKK